MLNAWFHIKMNSLSDHLRIKSRKFLALSQIWLVTFHCKSLIPRIPFPWQKLLTKQKAIEALQMYLTILYSVVNRHKHNWACRGHVKPVTLLYRPQNRVTQLLQNRCNVTIPWGKQWYAFPHYDLSTNYIFMQVRYLGNP